MAEPGRDGGLAPPPCRPYSEGGGGNTPCLTPKPKIHEHKRSISLLLHRRPSCSASAFEMDQATWAIWPATKKHAKQTEKKLPGTVIKHIVKFLYFVAMNEK